MLRPARIDPPTGESDYVYVGAGARKGRRAIVVSWESGVFRPSYRFREMDVSRRRGPCRPRDDEVGGMCWTEDGGSNGPTMGQKDKQVSARRGRKGGGGNISNQMSDKHARSTMLQLERGQRPATPITFRVLRRGQLVTGVRRTLTPDRVVTVAHSR